MVAVRHDVRLGDAGAALPMALASLWSADHANQWLDTLFEPYQAQFKRQPRLVVAWCKKAARGQWIQQVYHWPDWREAYLAHAEKVVSGKADVYAAFNLFARQADEDCCKRWHSGSQVHRRPPLLDRIHTLAFDVDQQRDADALDRLQAAGAMLVSSGTPGNVHAYLTSPEPQTKAAMAHWARAMKQSLGLDRVLSFDQPLRLPGTGNFKAGIDGAPVRIIEPGDASRFLAGVRDLVDGSAIKTMTFGVDFGTGVTSAATGGDWHDVSKGARGGRPQGDGRTSIPFRHQISFGWFCEKWEAGYSDDEAVALTLWTEVHGEDTDRRRAVAIVDKFGRVEALQQEAARVYAKRDAKATDVERANRPSRRALFPALPACHCCTGGGAS